MGVGPFPVKYRENHHRQNMNTLTLTPEVCSSITITPDAEKQKADALELAKTITRVPTSAAEQADGIAAASICKGLVKGMEASREEVKKPVLDLGRDIDGKAKKYSAPLSAEILRIESLCAEYQRKENARIDALRREEEARQAKERETAQKDLEREKRFMEDKEGANLEERRADLERIAAATTDEEREEARRIADQNADARAEEWRNLQQACTEAQETRFDEMRERATALAAIEPVKAAGATVRQSYDYTVLDVGALYRARPDLVSLEPKRAMILSAICNGHHIAGLSVFETTKVSAKATL